MNNQPPAHDSVPDPDDRIAQLEQQLKEAHDTIVKLDRRQKIDSLLVDSDAIDLEAARLLTEIAVEQMSQPDLRQAIADLKKHKPYLFSRNRTAPSGPDSEHVSHPRSGRPLDVAARSMPARSADSQHSLLRSAAQRAATTGNRRDLLRYLRLRRD